MQQALGFHRSCIRPAAWTSRREEPRGPTGESGRRWPSGEPEYELRRLKTHVGRHDSVSMVHDYSVGERMSVIVCLDASPLPLRRRRVGVRSPDPPARQARVGGRNRDAAGWTSWRPRSCSACYMLTVPDNLALMLLFSLEGIKENLFKSDRVCWLCILWMYSELVNWPGCS